MPLLEGLKEMWPIFDLNEAYSSPTFTPSLIGVIRGEHVFKAIFGIKSKVLMRPLRKYDFIVFLKWIILNPVIIMVLPFK